MRHADLQRAVAAVISAKPASALLYDAAVWYLVLLGGWTCGCVCFCGGMSDAMGLNTTCKTFSTYFFDWIRQSENSVQIG